MQPVSNRSEKYNEHGRTTNHAGGGAVARNAQSVQCDDIDTGHVNEAGPTEGNGPYGNVTPSSGRVETDLDAAVEGSDQYQPLKR